MLNIIGSFTGVVWRLFEDFPVEDCEKEDAFSKVLSRLDRNFEYDDRVLLPNDFENYFTNLQRKGQQSLLSFVTDHDEAYRKITGHKITLPSQVQGWHLLKRAGLTREQRQMVTLKAPTLEKPNVIEALFLLYMARTTRPVDGHHGKDAAMLPSMKSPLNPTGARPTMNMNGMRLKSPTSLTMRMQLSMMKPSTMEVRMSSMMTTMAMEKMLLPWPRPTTLRMPPIWMLGSASSN